MLVYSDESYFPRKAMQTDQLGNYTQHSPIGSVFNGGITPPFINPLTPFHSVNIQPSNCPRDLVIFDQTTNNSQTIFHPKISSKFSHPAFGGNAISQDNIDQRGANNETKPTTSPSEDPDDIDALLSTEDETEECDDDEASTARTGAMYECHSPESCCIYESESRKNGARFWKSSRSPYNDKKRARIKKMLKALRGIVPGASRMSTVALLDEAVHYLKSLGLEVKKLGVRN